MKVTIKEVAKEANVSIATVSRVINNADDVSVEIKEKVEKAIAYLNYHPNSLARSLKNNITKTIGIIVADLSISFFSHIIGQIEKKSEEQGYGIIVVSSDDQPTKEYNCIKMLMEKRVDGIIIASTGFNLKYLNDINESGIPVILIDRRPNMFSFDVIFVDKILATYNVFSMLLQKGHRKIAFISGPKELPSNQDRYIGITQAVYDHGLTMDVVSSYYGEYSIQYGRKVFRDLFSSKEKPTVIFAGSEAITYGIMIGAKELNIRIPDDVSLVSSGINEDLLELIQPKITYIEDLKNEIGEIAGDLVFKRIKDNSSKETVTLQAKIIDHGSVLNLTL
jgi:LacI family transcriptional regulator